MFINKLMSLLWKENTDIYNKIYEESMHIDIKNLYDKVNDLVEKDNYLEDHGLGLYVNILNTMGCTYCYRNNQYSGCSMCNWATDCIEFNALVNALRKRDESLYNKIIVNGFKHFREVPIKGEFAEEYVVHDAFDSWQIPDSLFQFISGKSSIYLKQPSIGVLQARANNITLERINKWKTVFSKAINVSIGVEIHNEWLRNHWLNKSITNEQINKSFSLLKENGIKTSANILFGIPGMNELQSINIFIDSIKWLNNNDNIDMITISPLIDKDFTLQNTINNINHKNNLTIASFFCALSLIVDQIDEIEHKIVISPENTKKFFKSFDKKSSEDKFIIKFILSIMKIGSYTDLKEIKKYKHLSDKIWAKIKLENDDSINLRDSLAETMIHNVETITKTIEDENITMDDVISFKKELEGFKYD